MDQIPSDLLLSEDAVRAGLEAMERIHGRHLGQMTPEEQQNAREHWRAQVEQILASAHAALVGGHEGPGGRAVISFSDQGGEEVEVGVAFTPDLRQVSEEEVEGTSAQLLALSLLESLQEDDEDGHFHDHEH